MVDPLDRQRKYRQSEKGKETQKRYLKTEKGRAAKRRQMQRYRARLRSEQTGEEK